MDQLRFRQETLFFFLILVLLLQVAFVASRFDLNSSHPLIGAAARPQKDGGFLR